MKSKKGDMSINAVFSLILVVLIVALAAYLIYRWTNQGSDVFSNYISIPGVG